MKRETLQQQICSLQIMDIEERVECGTTGYHLSAVAECLFRLNLIHVTTEKRMAQ